MLAGNPESLKALYSIFPAAQVSTTAGKEDAASDVTFWTALGARTMAVNVVEFGSRQAGVVSLTAQLKVTSANGKTTNVVEGQTWQNQGGVWRLVRGKRDVARLSQPASVAAHIYPDTDAHEEIRSALARAGREHKNILVIFGGDWCYDCHVLEKAFQRPDVAAVLKPNYDLVRVDVGEFNKNLDIASQFDVPLDRGVPAIAVLSSEGKLLYSQKNGEWERARALGPQDLIGFLAKWKP